MTETDQQERLAAALAERYEVQRSLGEGGMATVYLARDIKHERQVAIKVLKPELAASIGTERFLREIKVAAQLQHPNILALYDSGEASHLLYYVMPFVEGESLRDRLDRDKQLPIGEAVTICREVADALNFAHERGVIHRDIKPENVLLQGGHALVADFGIARALSQAGAEKLTQTGMVIGTPHYMSPEQGTGSDVDGRGDVYSVGCLLYELLVGQPPFDGPNAMAILARHSLESVPAMRVVRRTIPDELEEVVDQALEKSPADRFQTAAELSEALGGVDLSAVPRRTPGRGTTSRVQARKKKRDRTRVLVGAAGAVILVAAVAGVVALRGNGGGARSTAAAGPDPRSIAVLYFEDRGGGEALRHLADGLTETLIQELSQVQGLEVISRSGVGSFRGGTVSPDSVSRVLNVGTLVTGILSQSDDRLRLQVSLVNPRGVELGATQLVRPRGEIFALQEELAREVSEFLRTTLGEEIRLRESRHATRSVRAWELVQEAEVALKDADAVLGTGAPDAADAARRQWARADSLLTIAADEDRAWATPPARRGWLAYRRCRTERSFDHCERGLGLAEDALGRSAGDPDALELRGTLTYWTWLSGREPDAARAARLFQNAEADWRAAIAANPMQASAWTSLSHLLFNKPAVAEAKLAALKAYESDPYLTNANETVWRLFQASLDLEDHVEATHWCAEGRRRFSEFFRFAECELWRFALKDVQPDVAAAWAARDRYVELSPPQLREFRAKRGRMLVSFALIRANLPDSARRVMVSARTDASVDVNRELAYIEGLARIMIGDLDEAIQLFATFLASNPQQARSLSTESWWTRDLRADPRWEQLRTLTSARARPAA